MASFECGELGHVPISGFPMNLGDIFWVEFPRGVGHAQAGRRPAIVMQTPETSRQVPTILLIPLTTQQDALRFPGTLLVEPDVDVGLRHPSVALVFQFSVIDQKFLGNQLGKVTDSVLDSLWQAFDEITGRARNQ